MLLDLVKTIAFDSYNFIVGMDNPSCSMSGSTVFIKETAPVQTAMFYYGIKVITQKLY